MFPKQVRKRSSRPGDDDGEEADRAKRSRSVEPEDYDGSDMGAAQDYAHEGGSWAVASGGHSVSVPQIPFLQTLREDLQARYRHASSASDAEEFPHLNQERTINNKVRRAAHLTSPRDRSAIVREAQDQGHAHPYVSLSAPSQVHPGTSLDLGRVSKSPFAQPREQHFYDSSSTFTPYPAEGLALNRLTDDDVSAQDVWGDLRAANRGEKPQALPDEEQHLLSVPTIVNLAETQRSPLMAAASNLEIANQAQNPDGPRSFREAFGHSVKKVNFPGTIAATGSGAVHQFGAIESGIEDDDLSDESLQQSISRAPQGMGLATARQLTLDRRDNLLNTFDERFQMTDVERAMQEEDEQARQTSVTMRLQSAVNREMLPPMGLLPYHLRPLLKKPGEDD